MSRKDQLLRIIARIELDRATPEALKHVWWGLRQ
jgi:hypothetical protein